METNTGNTPGSENLLPPWPKGVSGNPKGRPKGSRNRQSIFQEWLEFVPEGDELPNVDLVVKGIIEKAKTGDVAAAKEALDSGYGKTADNLNIESPKGTMSPPLSRLADFVSRKKTDE